MSNTITDEEKAIRRQHVEEAINSVELEGLTVSDAQRNVFEKYAQGLISLDELTAITEKNYGTKD